MHFDVIALEIGVREAVRLRLFAGDLFELERRAGHHVVNRFVARDAPLADWIPELPRAGRRRCHFVVDLERRGFGRQQLVQGVFVLRRLPLLRADRRGDEEREEKNDCNRA